MWVTPKRIDKQKKTERKEEGKEEEEEEEEGSMTIRYCTEKTRTGMDI